MLRNAYKEFERQVESTEARPAKSDLVRQAVLGKVEQFTLGDLAAQLAAASPQLVKKVLAELKGAVLKHSAALRLCARSSSVCTRKARKMRKKIRRASKRGPIRSAHLFSTHFLRRPEEGRGDISASVKK